MNKCSCNDNDKCILHCEKNDWYEVDDNGNKNWDNKKIKFFWNQIQKDLNEKYEESFNETEVINEIYIYDNVIFPKFQKDIAYNKYEDNQVKLGTNFYSYSDFIDDESGYREELNTIISKLNVSFKNCKFLDNIELSRYNFKKDLDFEKCEYFGNFNLNNTNVKGRITFSKSFFYKKLRLFRVLCQ